ncbi:MAG: iron ABC transporter permease [Firmicutes bacterium]|nr:iron ABC transporter permease [Bacillota bacterium]
MGKSNPENGYDLLKRRLRCETVFVLLILAFCVITVLNINIGSVPISVKEIARILFLQEGDATQMNIVWRIRLPRIITAAVLGGGLSLSGFLLQTFFSNPIAGPFVLGISSGAKLTVALTMIYALSWAGHVSSFLLVLAAFVGSMLSTGFILLVSSKLKNMSALLVAGIMIGYICSAITDFAVTFAEESDIINLRNWSLGSFSGMSWDNVKIACIIVGITSVCVFFLSKPINAYQLGENYARSMGVNIKMFRTALILLSSVLSATVTAFAGPISFVGIAVPHLIKRSLNTSKPIVVIPACFLGGAVFCMFCDLVARTAFAPSELNISTVTSIFGAPVVIAMMIKRQKEKQ